MTERHKVGLMLKDLNEMWTRKYGGQYSTYIKQEILRLSGRKHLDQRDIQESQKRIGIKINRDVQVLIEADEPMLLQSQSPNLQVSPDIRDLKGVKFQSKGYESTTPNWDISRISPTGITPLKASLEQARMSEKQLPTRRNLELKKNIRKLYYEQTQNGKGLNQSAQQSYNTVSADSGSAVQISRSNNPYIDNSKSLPRIRHNKVNERQLSIGSQNELETSCDDINPLRKVESVEPTQRSRNGYSGIPNLANQQELVNMSTDNILGGTSPKLNSADYGNSEARIIGLNQMGGGGGLPIPKGRGQNGRDFNSQKISVWDAMTINDTNKYKKEQDRKVLQKRKAQAELRSYLEKQMNGTVTSKQLEKEQKLKDDHLQIIDRIKEFDMKEEARKRWLSEQNGYTKQINDTNIKQIGLVKRLDLEVDADSARQAPKGMAKIFAHENDKQSRIKRIMQDNQTLLKDVMQNKSMLNSKQRELDYVQDELAMKTQIRQLSQNIENHHKKIHQLDQRNMTILKQHMDKGINNLATFQHQRDGSLKSLFEKQSIEQTYKVNKMYDEREKVKKTMVMDTHLTHLNQINERQVREKESKLQNLSIEEDIVKNDLSQLDNDKVKKYQLKITKQKQIRNEIDSHIRLKESTKDVEKYGLNPKEFGMNKKLLNEIGLSNHERQLHEMEKSSSSLTFQV